MPRIRTLKPEFWADEKLAPLSPLDRLVFLGLISMADDAGRILDNVRVIDATLFSQTPDTALEALRRLAGIGRIRRGLTASGQRVIQIVNWYHQKISHPNFSSAFPEIVEDVEDTEAPEALRNGSGMAPEPLPNPSGAISTIYDLRSTTSTNDPLSAPGRRTRKAAGGAERAENWPAEAFEMYKAEIGILPVGRIARALKPAVHEFGWELVKKWFAVYLSARPYLRRDGSVLGDKPGDTLEGAAKETRWVSPEDFVKNMAIWRERCAPLATK